MRDMTEESFVWQGPGTVVPLPFTEAVLVEMETGRLLADGDLFKIETRVLESGVEHHVRIFRESRFVLVRITRDDRDDHGVAHAAIIREGLQRLRDEDDWVVVTLPRKDPAP